MLTGHVVIYQASLEASDGDVTDISARSRWHNCFSMFLVSVPVSSILVSCS